MKDIICVLLLYFLSPVCTMDNLCGYLRCCLGYEFDSSGQCVPCPRGRFGVNCTGSCPPGFYGHNCREPCECSHELCNAAIGCIKYACPNGSFGVNCTESCPPGFYGDNCREPCECSHEFCNATVGCIKYDVDYFNPTTLSIVIPTTLGLLCIFLLGCTLIVLKMRQRAQQLVPQASVRSRENDYDITSPGQGSRTYNELDSPDDFPPPPYMVDLDDLDDLTCRRVDSKLYDMLTD